MGFPRTPLAHAMALLTLAGGMAWQDAAQARAWFAADGAGKSAAGSASAAARARAAAAGLGGAESTAAQQAASRHTLARSIANLNRTASAIAAQQAAQAAAREAARAAGGGVPDGLAEGGLKVDANPATAGWLNAQAPIQTVSGGNTTVTVRQTADRAILNWETFNVGRNTTVAFQNQQADWAVLNRVNDPQARPSQIQGAIRGDGTVMVVNRNGIVFGAGSQVDARNLVAAAAAIGDEQFRDRGLYNGANPVFDNAGGKVVVEQGALIRTATPTSSTTAGGYVLLLGKQVENAGTVSTPKGQTLLAAGDSFAIVRGQGTAGNQDSTTRGNLVTPGTAVLSDAGTVLNTGLIQAAMGDVSLLGRDVTQAGVAVATTSVDLRGTVHLGANGAEGRITLGKDGVTSVLLEDTDATALDSQRDGLQAPALDTLPGQNIVATDIYRRDLSLVEIVSGGVVDFEAGSLTLATGGQIGVQAGSRAMVRDGAVLDVAGAVGVRVAMESNNLRIDVQGNEQRDAAVNRDSKNLNNNDVWLDRRALVYVPAGTNGYASDRWYTAGGLLEVGGYLATSGRGVSEWMAQGGLVRFTGDSVVTQAGSQINLSGGTLDVQSGYRRLSWLRGLDGRLYTADRAPGDLLYTGLYRGYEDTSERWARTRYFRSPVIGPQRRFEPGYTVGRDAGALAIGTRGAVLEGDIVGEVFQGGGQTEAAQAGLDGYYQSQRAAARGAQLIVGDYRPYYVRDSGTRQYGLTATANTIREVILGTAHQRVAAALDLDTALPEDREQTLYLDTGQLNGFHLGVIEIAAAGGITVDGAVQTAPGGEITLYSSRVSVNADLTSRGGSIQLGNVLHQISGNLRLEDAALSPLSGTSAGVMVDEGVMLDTSGLWSNLLLDPAAIGRLPYRDGGSVSLRSTGAVVLAEGSVLDVSSGAAILADGAARGGRGGDVTLWAGGTDDPFVFDGGLRAHGVDGGGTLALYANQVLIGDAPSPVAAGTLTLDAGFFDKGFSHYDVTAKAALTVAQGAQVDVTMPVYRYRDRAQAIASGSQPAAALASWTPPLYQEDPRRGILTQRHGASLALTAGSAQSDAAAMATTAVTLGQGSAITVDPGQSIEVRSIGQLTVDGTLNAWGGNVTLGALAVSGNAASDVNAAGHGRSIWLGAQSLIDVAARAVSAVDEEGRAYGHVPDGGRIEIGGDIDPVTGAVTAADLFVVVRDGARLLASGAQASLDLPGQGRTQVASHGGSISLASSNGLYLDGSFGAHAGGAGAAGGSLSVVLQTPAYLPSAATDRVRQVRELIIGDAAQPSLLPDTAQDAADSLIYGRGRLGVAQVAAGGFDNVALFSASLLSFDGDVSLATGQSLSLYAGALALAEGAPDHSRVHLAAPYLRLAGAAPVTKDYHTTPSSTLLGYTSNRPTQATFSAVADLLDVQGSVVLGSMGQITKADGSTPTIERRGFDDVQLVSQGDLRFAAGVGPVSNLTAGFSTQLVTMGDLTLRAAQLYPTTGTGARLRAGYYHPMGGSETFDPQRSLTIARTGTDIPGVPLSVFGRLRLEAATIEQGGVLRAPLGLIEIGGVYSTSRVDLLPGSLTSVSANGLTMPYGGTVDGLTYLHAGVPVTPIGQSGVTANGTLTGAVVLAGESITVLPEAILDLSGGGDLRGAGFVSGRGGSTDARYHPLVQTDGGAFRLPGLAANPVYAVVPGIQPGQAPTGGDGGPVDPMAGQQISIGSGVPGLPAGTYTLMPSTYALLPGAFRVELNGLTGAAGADRAFRMRNGSWSTSGQLSIANTGIRDSLSRQVILTPADVLRTYSQYNETSYADFAMADARRLGVARPMLPADAKSLQLDLVPGAGKSAFSFHGVGRFDAAEGGYAGAVSVIGTRSLGGIEIVAANRQTTENFAGATVDADSLNALGAARLVVGGVLEVRYGQAGHSITFGNGSKTADSVVLRQGAVLSAPEVFLTSDNGDIVVEQGASITTLGRGEAAYDARDGYVYQVNNMLAVSNGLLNVLHVAPPVSPPVATRIKVGSCDSAACGGQTALYSEGSIAAVTGNSLQLGEQVRYGARHLTLALENINVGSSLALADAAARNVLPAGLTLSQPLLDRLLQGDTQTGAPALETLELSAHAAFNFYGTASLDTYDARTGKSLLTNLMLTAPAIYGAGSAADVATIRTANLIWNGTEHSAGAVIAGGAGAGNGRLDIQTDTIEFGYGAFSQPGSATLGRLALGFADVNLSARDRITSNHHGSLSVYRAQGAYDAATGFAYSGGNLNIVTPLLTGEAGSVNHIVAGGAIHAASSGAATAGAAGMGAQLSMQGDSVVLDTAVVLPSGKLTVNASHDVTLADGALIDVAGRAVPFNDLTKYSWGGDVVLRSRSGDIRQAAGSRIDFSARFNRGGQLSVVALDPAAGLVDLQGSLIGGSSGHHDAGGTYVPYLAGGVEIQARRLSVEGTLDEPFAALNQRLNDGQVFGSRSFQLKQGSLTIGNDLKAGTIALSLDDGSLMVSGTIDASGEQVGNISLSAKHGLTLGGGAVLDAHGSRLRVDSYGKIIDSPNRAMVRLNSGDGLLTLASGARIDLRHATDVAVGALPGQYDGAARGTLELDAPRMGGVSAGDIAIDASGSLAIQGARSIAVNGTWRYDDARFGTDPAASGRPYQIVDQGYLDAKHAESESFIAAALNNGDLMQRKLAGLNNAAYIDVLHVRPGIEIVSATPDGDLVVQGDLDLSRHRYASINPHARITGVYGSGETGTLALRAGGDLSIYGSINDGFAPPPATQDDAGWQLLPGVDFTGGDIVVPGPGVTLADGTTFPAGATLNFDLPIKGAALAGGVRLPVPATLDQDVVLPAGTVLAAAIRDGAGTVLFAAGTLLDSAQTIVAGSQLDAGTLLVGTTALRGFVWPKGVPLPGRAGGFPSDNLMTLDGSLSLARGSLIPSGTNVKLPAGVDSVQLRPEVAGRQGAMWGIAPMLAEGSQSWSLRLVAGADTTAADHRVVQAFPAHGDLVLADSHYGMFGKALPGGLVWTEAGSIDFLGDTSLVGLPVSDYVDEFGASVDEICSWGAYCTAKSSYGWSQVAVDELASGGIVVVVGDPVDPDMVGGDVAAFCRDSPTYCISIGETEYELLPGSARFSVVRTGMADLELLSAGSLRMESLFGVYTAGTSSAPSFSGDPYNQRRALGADGTVLSDANGSYEHLVDGGADSVYRAWYPTGGGNLTLKVGGDLTGNIMSRNSAVANRPNPTDAGHGTENVGNWLWRQGSGDVATGGQAQPTAWWINFGTYTNTALIDGATPDQMVGFTGFGTLGGGNLDVQVGGDAGIVNTMSGNAIDLYANPRSQGLILAVGSTGRVASDGALQLTGGGDLTLRVGGALNPASTLTSSALNGAVVGLRGNVQLDAGTVGSLELLYGSNPISQSRGETRAYSAVRSTRAAAAGGLTFVPGDAAFALRTAGDQVVQDVTDPGRAILMNGSSFTRSTGEVGAGLSWFSLWTGHTAVDLVSAGGNLTPVASAMQTDLAVVYPSILRAVAASGSLYYGDASRSTTTTGVLPRQALVLAPSDGGRLELLAADSIYGGEMSVSRSGAASGSMATPLRPGFIATSSGGAQIVGTNLHAQASQASSSVFPLFAFGPDSAEGLWAGGTEPARFYALAGDLLGVDSGRIVTFTSIDVRLGQSWYEGRGPVWMIAGRDIVSSGTPLGQDGNANNPSSGLGVYRSTGNVFVQDDPTDISIVSAGRDILHSNFNVAGPGLLEISAGRHILMDDKAAVTSLGPVKSGDTRPGAGIAMIAGAGASGPDYAGFIKAYLDPANQAQAGLPLADQAGKVAKTYEDELLAWLGERYGFGSIDEARAQYAALPAQQQRIFARDVYFAELRAGGREYNEAGGPREGSYLRGRRAIAALFPDRDAAGNTIVYQGDITMYGGAGVHTDFGGGIQMLSPGGAQTFGIEGNAPPATAGITTQGEGDIQLYSLGSILLGQSRIMTTFGGAILAWSAQGDINAGRGSKTTVVYTPPRRVYDAVGNVTISPDVPSTGAGIATLNPIPEVPPGDVDLIAPLGTIDAGEAGIRASGNVNIAALQVVNAANIQVQGESSGIPVAAAVNVGALTSASAAASNAATAAQDAMARSRAATQQSLPSVISVQILGFGGEPDSPAAPAPSRTPSNSQVRGDSYDPTRMVKVVGMGNRIDPAYWAKLSEAERQRLGQGDR